MRERNVENQRMGAVDGYWQCQCEEEALRGNIGSEKEPHRKKKNLSEGENLWIYKMTGTIICCLSNGRLEALDL